MANGTLLIQDTIQVSSVEEFMDLFHRMVKRVEEPNLTRDQFQPVVDELQEIHRGYFDSGVDPNGDPWAPLAELTIANKGHDRILIEESYLKDSLTDGDAQYAIREFESDSLVFGTNRPWAWIHQDGGEKIPQRQHTGLGESGTDSIMDVLADVMVLGMFQER